MILGIFIFIIWYLAGVASFIYWWTTDMDFEKGDIPLALVAGFIGPIAFLAGYSIHGRAPFQDIESKVLIEKRKEKND